MTIFTGKDGKFTFAGEEQINVRSWTVEASLALLEVTTLGDNSVNNEAGLKSFSGTAQIMYHDDNQTLKNIVDDLFTTSVPVKASALFQWSSDRQIAFDAFITSCSVATSIGEIMTADLSFTASGDLANSTAL